MLANQARRFGETLVDRHVLSRDDLEHALDEARANSSMPLPIVLLRRGLVGSKDLTAALADRWVSGSSTSSRRRSTRTRRRSSPPNSLAGTPRCRSTSRTTSSSSRSPSRPTTRRVAGDRCRDGIRDHPRGRRPRRARPRDRHDLRRRRRARPRPDRRQPSSGWSSGRRDRARRAAHQRPARARDPVAAAPTSTSRRARRRSCACTAICIRSRDLPTLNGSQIRQMVYSILTQKQREKFENELELDTSYALPGKGRFRVNVFLQRDSVGCVMRAIPYEIVDFDVLGVPPVGEDVGVPARVASCSSPARPVPGSRRRSRRSSTSSTASASVHIMTVEDPIEFLHHAQALADQPARGRRGHALVRERRSSTCCARTPT